MLSKYEEINLGSWKIGSLLNRIIHNSSKLKKRRFRYSDFSLIFILKHLEFEKSLIQDEIHHPVREKYTPDPILAPLNLNFSFLRLFSSLSSFSYLY